MRGRELSPCGCGGWDKETFAPDDYCAKCHHHGCGVEVKCQ